MKNQISSEGIKKAFINVRNIFAWSYAWLVICAIIVMLMTGSNTISLSLLKNLLLLSAWGSVCFTFVFLNKKWELRGFIFQLTLFYILFIPVETILFFMMGILGSPANKMSWGIFLFIILFLYVISLFIDTFVMKKKGFFYTYQLKKYNRSIVEDRRNEHTSCNGFSEKS
jgi:hypothetical protein